MEKLQHYRHPQPTVAFGIVVDRPIIDGRECRIHGPSKDGTVTFIVNDTNEFIQIQEDEFRRKIRAGEIVFDVHTAEAQVDPNVVRSFAPRKGRSHSDIEEANYRAYIGRRALRHQKPKKRCPHRKWDSIIEDAHYEFLREHNYPKWLVNREVPTHWSVRRWIRQADRDLDPIRYVPRYARCGTHGSRLLSAIEEIVQTEIERIWREQPEISREKLTQLVQSAVKKTIEARPELAHYKLPSIATIRRRINDLGGEEVLRRTRGKRAANIAYKNVGAGPDITRPNQRWEMDHHKLDVLVQDPTSKKILGRPWLTVVLDCATRSICAYVLSLEQPNSKTILEAIRLAILPKSEIYLRRIGVTKGWRSFGMPAEIATDRGRDFISRAVLMALSAMGISIVTMPPYAPQMKGRIERFFGTLNTGLIHHLPGTTKSSPKHRGEKKPSDLAVLSLIQLDSMIGKWVCDIYHFSFNRGLGDTPNDAWATGIRLYPIKPFKSVDWVRFRTMLRHEATASREGLTIEGLHYNSETIRSIRSKHHAATRGDPTITVFLDPEDVSRVYVQDPHSDEFVPVLATNQKITNGVSWRMHAFIRKRISLKRNHSRFEETYGVERAILFGQIAELHKRAKREASARARIRKEKRTRRTVTTPRPADRATNSRSQQAPSPRKPVSEQLKAGPLPELQKTSISSPNKKG